MGWNAYHSRKRLRNTDFESFPWLKINPINQSFSTERPYLYAGYLSSYRFLDLACSRGAGTPGRLDGRRDARADRGNRIVDLTPAMRRLTSSRASPRREDQRPVSV